MNKSVIGLVIAIIIIGVVVTGFAVYRNSNTSIDNNNTEENVANNRQEGTQTEKSTNSEENTNIVNTENIGTSSNTENTTSSESKILVVYYSAQSHTKSVAERIARNLNADIFEIIPENVYTEDDLNWSNGNSRVSKEHNDESLRNIPLKNTKVDNWESYDTVLIGYPIWWGIAAWPVDNFVKANNFDGKKVIPFCTSASSGLGQSGSLLQGKAGTGNWVDGHRFSSNASDTEIKSWTDSLK